MDYKDKDYKCAVVRFHFNALKKSLDDCHDEEVETALARMDGYLGRLEAYFERKANEQA